MNRPTVKKARPEEAFVPLRKCLKRKSTGKEDNFMQSYYKEPDDLGNLTEADVEELRWTQSIQVQGEDCPRPIRTFSDLNLPPDLQKYLADQGYLKPTPIQSQALSCVMSGRDVIGLAETGSGKTLSYTLPLCMFLKSKELHQQGHSPTCLVLTPTRELMHQVLEHVTGLLSYVSSDAKAVTHDQGGAGYSAHQHWARPAHGINAGTWSYGPSPLGPMPQAGAVSGYGPFTHVLPSGPQPSFFPNSMPSPGIQAYQQHAAVMGSFKAVGVCGGVPISTQIQELRQGADVVIATPGRLLDLCERGIVSLDKVAFLVIDEADRLLGMGLEEQLRRIVGLATGAVRARQTMLWSATMPDSLERLARSAVLNPITIQVGPAGIIAPHVQQNVYFAYHYEKPKKLLQLLRSTPYPPVIVFASSIQNVDYVVELLKKEQFHVSGLHSQKTQDYRFRLVTAFRDGKVDVLVATDVASRGLDFPDVTHVINYDLPDTIEDYVHRCGRTGRMGQAGLASSFLTLDCQIAEELKEMLQVMEQAVPKELENVKQFGKKIIRTEFGDRVVKN